MGFTNSPLVSYTRISPNRGNWTWNGRLISYQRTMAIDRISIHCVVGQCSAQTLGAIFAPWDFENGASSNYGVGYNGAIGMFCEEKDRSWCTSSGSNDNRAVTIEVASNSYHPYWVNNTAYNATIQLVADICRRNGKNKVVWIPDKFKALAYTPKSNEMLLTVHRWFDNKSCPGDYLYGKHADIAAKVNAILAKSSTGSGGSSNTTKRKETCTVEVPILRQGDKNGYVRTAQILLNAYYGAGLTTDGDFGPPTYRAVIGYQKNRGLAVDGIIGPQVWAQLVK